MTGELKVDSNGQMALSSIINSGLPMNLTIGVGAKTVEFLTTSRAERVSGMTGAAVQVSITFVRSLSLSVPKSLHHLSRLTAHLSLMNKL